MYVKVLNLYILWQKQYSDVFNHLEIWTILYIFTCPIAYW